MMSVVANCLKNAKSWVECLLSGSGFCVEPCLSLSFPQAPESEMSLPVREYPVKERASASVSLLNARTAIAEELKLLTNRQNTSSRHR